MPSEEPKESKVPKPKQIDSMEIMDDDDRVIKGFITVEMVDLHGDIIPVGEMKKTMNTFMKRGGFLIDTHTNRVIGKVLNWSEAEKDGKKGIQITAQIYDDYEYDDMIWKAIKDGTYTGFSFGGRSLDQSPTKVKEGEGGVDEDGKKRTVANELRNLEAFEISVVEKPACPEALFDEVNYLAKSADGVAPIKPAEVEKPNDVNDKEPAQRTEAHDKIKQEALERMNKILQILMAETQTIKGDLAVTIEENNKISRMNEEQMLKEAEILYNPFLEPNDLKKMLHVLKQDIKEKAGKCCLCGDKIEGYGNNCEPLCSGKCCDFCNRTKVIPARLYGKSTEKAEKKCPDCKGTGEEKCWMCNGKGREKCIDCEGTGLQECPKCKGKGEIKGKECPECDGEGYPECKECEGQGDVECTECYGEKTVDCHRCSGRGTIEKAMLDKFLKMLKSKGVRDVLDKPIRGLRHRHTEKTDWSGEEDKYRRRDGSIDWGEQSQDLRDSCNCGCHKQEIEKVQDNAICPYCKEWQRVELDDMKHDCKDCGKTFVVDSDGLSYKIKNMSKSDMKEFIVSLKRKLAGEPEVDDNVDKEIPESRSYRERMRREIRCPKCNSKFETADELNEHITDEHRNKSITKADYDVNDIANKLDFSGDINQLRLGIKAESEHADVVGNDPIAWAKIAMKHLTEVPDYYTKLQEVEGKNLSKGKYNNPENPNPTCDECGGDEGLKQVKGGWLCQHCRLGMERARQSDKGEVFDEMLDKVANKMFGKDFFKLGTNEKIQVRLTVSRMGYDEDKSLYKGLALKCPNGHTGTPQDFGYPDKNECPKCGKKGKGIITRD